MKRNNLGVLTTAGAFALAAALLAVEPPAEAYGSAAAGESRRTIFVEGRGTQPSFSALEQHDYRMAAKRSGETPDALLSEAIPADDHAAIGRWIREQGGAASFAQSRVVVREGAGALQLQFAGEPPVGMTNFLERFPFDTEIVVGVPLSESEVERAASRVQGIVAETRSQGVELAAGLNPEGTAYTIRVGTPLDTESAQELDTRLEAALADGFAKDVPVEVVVDPSLVPVEFQAAVQGGRKMARDNGDLCTTGFTAVRSGNHGAVTAGHCTNMTRYMDQYNVLAGGATATNPPGEYIDLKFYRTLSGHTTPPQFYTGNAGGGLRTLTSYDNAPQGSAVWAYGVSSFYRSGIVNLTNICRYIGATWTCGLDEVQVTSYGGDSGGPYFVQGTGRGTHTAGAPTSPVSYMTRIGRVANNLGATVKTG